MKIFKKISPNSQDLKKHKQLQWLGKFLHISSLWAFNRRTISRAFAVGLFAAFIPMPFQMILAATGAVIFSANLPIAVALVWITNPITIPPIFYALYKLGSWLLDTSIPQDFEPSLEYFWSVLPIIWQPLLLGSLVVSCLAAVLGYVGVNLLYRYNIYKYIKQKRGL